MQTIFDYTTCRALDGTGRSNSDMYRRYLKVRPVFSPAYVLVSTIL